MIIDRHRPRKESAKYAPKTGTSETTPIHVLTFAAAVARDSPSGPVR